MAKYVQRGEALDFANSSGSKINAGDVVVLGTRIGVVLPQKTDEEA